MSVPRSALVPARWARLLVAALTGLLFATAARAQQPTADVYRHLALRCLATAPDTVRAFRLEWPEAMPYLRPALTARWVADGRAVYLPGATADAATRLVVDVEAARVDYRRAARGRLRREVTLGLRYTLTASDGRLLAEDACTETAVDTVARALVARLEDPALPETRGAVPPGGWLRRYAEPIVLAAATAVGTYLFFSLRSRKAAGG